MAEPYLSLVWVGFLGVNTTVLLDVGETIVHKTSLATMVSLSFGTVDQILQQNA